MKAFRPIAFAAIAMLAMPAATFAQVRVIKPERDVSKPLRDIQPNRPSAEGREEHPVKPVPNHSTGGKDTVLQSGPVTTAASVTAGNTFDGLGTTDASFTMTGEPPDTNGAVGATQYVQWVNSMFAIWDKSGNKVYGPANGNTLWKGSTIANGRCASDNSGDPIAQYDKANNRWIMTQFAVAKSPYYQCVAVSQTSDATGSWNLYAYNFGTNFNDYPKVGVWGDGNYYFTFNLFAHGRTFAGGAACAMDGASARAGAAANMICFNAGKSYGGLLPADVDGPTQPSGAEYAVNFGSNSLNVWRLTPNFSAGTMAVSGPTNIGVSSFSTACGGGACIPQKGTTVKLDSLADRLMYRLSYRQFAGYGSLLVNHSVVAGSSTGIRWYELRDSGSGPSVFQQGTFAPDSFYRWMGSAAQDKQGNIAVGYSISSSTSNASIRFASRAASDTAGVLGNETTVLTGVNYQNGHSRWGDYASISVDPVDDCTMWFTTEYMPASGDFKWATHINSFKLGTCQ